MKKVCLYYSFIPYGNLVFSFLGIFVFCSGAPAQGYKQVHDGVEYADVTREISGQQVRMNLLRLDLSKVRLDVVHAKNSVIGTDKTSAIAVSRGAIAAVNAGFFRLDTSLFAGDPAGILQIDGKLLSESTNGRIAMLITNDQNGCVSCRLSNDQSMITFEHLNTYAEFWSRQNRFNISGIDRQLKDNDAVLYTPEMGIVTPQTEFKVTEVVIENKMIKRVVETNGGTKIPAAGFVLTAAGSKNSELAAMAATGNEGITIIGSYADRDTGAAPTVGKMKFIDVEDIVGGVPQLIKDGKIDITWEKEKATRSFFETRHPRTAAAKLKDGKFLLITVDGRSESSGGISLADLASLLLELGATDAMNLDGGGSTTMYLEGNVVNHPSDTEGERAVSDALVVTARKKTLPKKN
ncbi:MAG: phosphodiester glycosidase family protein [Acidobacteriota bacterium]